jgi:hypothetical protein
MADRSSDRDRELARARDMSLKAMYLLDGEVIDESLYIKPEEYFDFSDDIVDDF